VEETMTRFDDDAGLFAELRAAADHDAPPAALADRVLDRIEYRDGIARIARERQRRRRSVLLAVTATLAAAAAGCVLALRAHHTSPTIAAEPGAPASAGQVTRREPPKVDACATRLIAHGAEPLIDDFEDGDDAVATLEQRAGFWRWARETDAPGTAPALLPVPRVAATRSNRLALHVKGAQLFDWGATVEFTFNPACYDASVYRGLSFQGRGPGRIYVSPREARVIPLAEGGSCERDCYNQHVKKIELEADWKTFEVSWEEVRQHGSERHALDPSRLNSIAFLIRAEDTPYDVWLDDVRFLTR
jgi:hypothetical protein